jgi:hypothetical protein
MAKREKASRNARPFCKSFRQEGTWCVLCWYAVLGRSGDDRLSRVLGHSTMGAGEFNGRVRDGIGFGLRAGITGPAKDRGKHCLCWIQQRILGLSLNPWLRAWIMRGNQADRAISTSKLNALPRLHPWPIDVVVFHGSRGSSGLEGGFPLRCLQRLSRPHIATLHCGWRHNSSTRGASIPVLSY